MNFFIFHPNKLLLFGTSQLTVFPPTLSSPVFLSIVLSLPVALLDPYSVDKREESHF